MHMALQNQKVKKPLRKRVKDKWDIDEDELTVKSGESDYWNEAHLFYEKVKNDPVHYMSEGQENWLDKIESDLQE